MTRRKVYFKDNYIILFLGEPMHPINQNPLKPAEAVVSNVERLFSTLAVNDTDKIWIVAESYLFSKKSSECSLQGRVNIF